MKCTIPEISWHNREPVLSVDIYPLSESFYKLASSGGDSHILIWQMSICENGSVKQEVISDLTRHQRSVNTVRWSSTGQYLASADDDGNIIVWQLKSDNIPLLEGDTDDKEVWVVYKILRGHKEDIYDLCWSPDNLKLLSGSVDNTAIIWDLTKGKLDQIISDHKGFVQGVAWDPENQLIATLSTDRVCRLFDNLGKQVKARILKGKLPVLSHHCLYDKEGKYFHDDTFKSFYRRLQFTPDGSLLLVPSGHFQAEECKSLNSTLVFTMDNWTEPAAILPLEKQSSTVVRCCPILFQHREDGPEPIVKLPYRLIFAVGTDHDIILYDTQQTKPFARFHQIHYTRITDLTWSRNGLLLIGSSTDGFCSLITFEPQELGDEYVKEESDEENNIMDVSEIGETSDKDENLDISNKSLSEKEDTKKRPSFLLQWAQNTPKKPKINNNQDSIIEINDEDDSDNTSHTSNKVTPKKVEENIRERDIVNRITSKNVQEKTINDKDTINKIIPRKIEEKVFNDKTRVNRLTPRKIEEKETINRITPTKVEEKTIAVKDTVKRITPKMVEEKNINDKKRVNRITPRKVESKMINKDTVKVERMSMTLEKNKGNNIEKEDIRENYKNKEDQIVTEDVKEINNENKNIKGNKIESSELTKNESEKINKTTIMSKEDEKDNNAMYVSGTEEASDEEKNVSINKKTKKENKEAKKRPSFLLQWAQNSSKYKKVGHKHDNIDVIEVKDDDVKNHTDRVNSISTKKKTIAEKDTAKIKVEEKNGIEKATKIETENVKENRNEGRKLKETNSDDVDKPIKLTKDLKIVINKLKPRRITPKKIGECSKKNTITKPLEVRRKSNENQICKDYSVAHTSMVNNIAQTNLMPAKKKLTFIDKTKNNYDNSSNEIQSQCKITSNLDDPRRIKDIVIISDENSEYIKNDINETKKQPEKTELHLKTEKNKKTDCKLKSKTPQSGKNNETANNNSLFSEEKRLSNQKIELPKIKVDSLVGKKINTVKSNSLLDFLKKSEEKKKKIKADLVIKEHIDLTLGTDEARDGFNKETIQTDHISDTPLSDEECTEDFSLQLEDTQQEENKNSLYKVSDPKNEKNPPSTVKISEESSQPEHKKMEKNMVQKKPRRVSLITLSSPKGKKRKDIKDIVLE